MKKLATIERIHSIKDHPNADVLLVAKVKEWPVVIKKDQYTEGDLVVFIVIDSIVPEENPYFEFLKGRKYRVWNAKFRGAPSQGLVCPVSEFGMVGGCVDHAWPATHVKEGDDVTETIGVTKYEKPIDASMAGITVGGFPKDIIPTTDEENLLNNSSALEEMRGLPCYITMKMDGSSCTIIHQDGVVRVCSRNLEQKEGTGFWKIVESLNLSKRLIEIGQNIAIQTEACGGKIQGNKMDLLKPELFVFDIRRLDTGEWVGWDDLKNLCKVLHLHNVPIIENHFILDSTWDIDRLQKIANDVRYTQRDDKEIHGEGIVLRPVIPVWSPTLGRKLSVKILNIEYKQ